MESGEKWWKVVESGEKWWKVVESGEKWWKVGKSGEKLLKVGGNGKKWGKVGKVGKSGKKWGKVGKSSEKLEKVGKCGVKCFFKFLNKMAARRPFWMSENNFRSQFLSFQIDTHIFFSKFLDILDWTTMLVIELVRDIWMNNACVKFEERSLNPSKVIALTTKL